jgi:hypothetical protein
MIVFGLSHCMAEDEMGYPLSSVQEIQMLRQIGFLSIAMLSFSFVHVAWAGADSSKMAALTAAKPDTGETKSASNVIAPQVAAVLGAATSIPASGMATGGIGAELSAISARLESSHALNPNAPLIGSIDK